jgi:hypothetical protein
VQMPELVAENLKLEKASQRLVEDFRRVWIYVILGHATKNIFPRMAEFS